MFSEAEPARTIYQVSELAGILRDVLEDALPRVRVQGEVSNFSRPASGHWYFTLKDAQAQLRCVMFKPNNFHVRPAPKDGDSVVVRAQVGMYLARGELQLVCEHLEPAGEGALLRAFEDLKKKLAAEGLFDAARKRALPAVPRGIGLITSATGAAVQDVLTTLSRRCPLVPVYLLPVPVQGPTAAPAIVAALTDLPRRAQVDVILLVRGGGSIEDLWAYNEESVARALRACTVPVISGVGHEIDFTIADFAADLRAPTPTAAAEMATPSVEQWAAALGDQSRRLYAAACWTLVTCDEQLQRSAGRLQVLHPGRRLRDAAQRLDELACRLHTQQPRAGLQSRRRQLRTLETQLMLRITGLLAGVAARMDRSQAMLRNLDPNAVLHRGYAVAFGADGRALTSAAQADIGERVRLRLARGALETEVTARSNDPPGMG